MDVTVIMNICLGLAETYEVFERRMGRYFVVDTSSDAEDIIRKFVRNRHELRFRITYSGELKAGGKQSRIEQKDIIRRYISSQLAELWTIHPVFKGYGLVYQPPREPFQSSDAIYGGGDFSFVLPTPMPHPRPQTVDVSPNQWHVTYGLNEPVEVNGRKYVPLVRNRFALTCGLDILFLRKGGEGTLIAEGGDLDNRIKTLFDGLRMPKVNEIRPPTSQKEVEEITYCLLEDDALITDFAVRTDRLLTHPGAKDSEVLLIIDVAIKATHLTSNNLGFMSE